MTLAHRAEQAEEPVTFQVLDAYGWPAAMDRKVAARYLSCSIPSFLREVAMGRLPQPIRIAGRDKWRKEDIDRALDRLAGEAMPDYRRRFLEGRAA